MSRRGMLISLDAAEPSPVTLVVGEPVRIVLELPKAPSIRACWLDCVGSVVRVDGEVDAHSVAFDVKRYRFRPSSQNISVGL